MSLQWTPIEVVDQLSKQPPRLGNWVMTERAQVLGGWLVRTYVVQREAAQVSGSAVEPEYNSSVGLTFVPDPNWAWDV